MKKILYFAACLGISGCISLPDVYLVDRHTVMEAEASGEWPELEKRFRQKALSEGPTNYAKELSESRRERAFRMLNSEFPVANNNEEKQTP